MNLSGSKARGRKAVFALQNYTGYCETLADILMIQADGGDSPAEVIREALEMSLSIESNMQKQGELAKALRRKEAAEKIINDLKD